MSTLYYYILLLTVLTIYYTSYLVDCVDRHNKKQQDALITMYYSNYGQGAASKGKQGAANYAIMDIDGDESGSFYRHHMKRPSYHDYNSRPWARPHRQPRHHRHHGHPGSESYGYGQGTDQGTGSGIGYYGYDQNTDDEGTGSDGPSYFYNFKPSAANYAYYEDN
ncbi:uncharacterized protein LOC128965146 [Oppia nitens]|uniref:uncharacterized protein LOC128965146 n=1 Tax=Oppia nitens TaxID=1686743 RepID=UPI0023DA9D28|nr:uncharacterized protein LOC128965146 [Oppia nitens]